MKFPKTPVPKLPKLKGMKKANKYLLCAVVVSVVLNLVLPLLAKQIATSEELKPSGSPASLSFKSQVMHMLVHHAHVPLASSAIVALIVALSIYLGNMCGKKL